MCLQKEIMKAKDMRIKLMSEMVNGIKIIKLYAWEKQFLQNIEKIRKAEVGLLKTQLYWQVGFIECTG